MTPMKTTSLPEIPQNPSAELQSTIPEKTEFEPEDRKLEPTRNRRSRSPLSKLPDGDLVLAYVRNHDTRATLGKIAPTKRGRAV